LKNKRFKPRLRPRDSIGAVSSTLTDEMTNQVLAAIDDAGLTNFLRVKQIANLEISPIFNTGVLALNLATGLTYPPGTDGYPRILIKAFTRSDQLPFDTNLEAGSSTVVAVMDSPVGYMKCVLIHELGHHVIFEGGSKVRELIRSAFLSGTDRISEYAGDNWEEYFCECFAAHTYYRNALLKFDQIGYNMVVEVLNLLGG
jgi:hypothetical protein